MGVPVTGTITATSPSDTYATTDPLTGIDSWRSVADHATRNAITALRRRQGMAVWTQNDSFLWTLNAAPWAFDDTDWTLFTGSAGSGTVVSVAVTNANGFSGTVANASTNAAITLSTTITGILKGNGTSISAANAGTDYLVTVPAPTNSTLGGVHSINAVSHDFLTSLDVNGNFAQAQPAFTDISGTVSTSQVASSAITFAKIQNVNAVSLLGNPTNSGAAPSEITLGANLSFNGTTLVASGGGGNGNTNGTVTSITAGAGLNGGTITATGTIALKTFGATITQALLDIATPSFSSTINFDLSAHTIFEPAVLTGNVILTLSNAPASTPWVRPFAVILTQDGTGSRLVSSWFSGFTITWDTGSPPVLQTAGGAEDTIIFVQTGATSLIGYETKSTINGTVTSITAGTGLTGGTITGSGTIALANPSASTLGGIQSASAVSHQWINSISTGGVPALSQPAFTDISGTVNASQLPTTGLIITQHVGPITTDSDGSTVTFNLAASDWHQVQLQGNRTLAVANSTNGQQFTLLLQNDNSARTPTWFNGISWMGATFTAPTMPTTGNAALSATFKVLGTNSYLGWWLGNNAT